MGEQALGVSLQDLAIPLKMGSSLVVELSHRNIPEQNMFGDISICCEWDSNGLARLQTPALLELE